MPSGVYTRTIGICAGENNNFYGRQHTEETKEKMRLKKLGVAQSKQQIKNRMQAIKETWDKKGRKEYKDYYHKKDKKYKDWRKLVFERDNYTCQNCKERGCYLEPHHIKGWAKYKLLRYELSNGISLCYECHKLTRKKNG